MLRKALEARLPVILVVNKVDRPDARIEEVVNEVYELFLDLDADETQIEFPIVYCNARAGRASLAPDPDALAPDLRPLLDLILERIPAPSYEEGHPLQALVTNLDASPYVGRLALCRVAQGTIRRGQQVAWCRANGTIERAKVTELYVTEALDRVEADEAGPGRDHRRRGDPRRDDRRDARRSRRSAAAAVIAVDEPSLSMTIGINTSPLAGLAGDKLTASLLESRLRTELVGNVSLRVLPTELARRVGGAGPRRAPARGARRADAPRGLRAHRRQAAGRHPRDRRHACTSPSSASRSTRPRSTSAS